ncbi:Wzz/FepE/Etk N-terminal domain-containing protein [Isoptericola sp. AK164]|uniref:Wzz/FepE/Etk N-terminal domain-containing protein n=1 Tax=Isoptericola sp. AK164 TaxID=3024246 RepID=UPI00241890C4|nr:Wzz/FepE/Etk N-terminal domain-containing protein [Isoptericola sp. AK164]
MTLREFFHVLWQGKWYVLVAIVAVVATGFVYAERQEVQYEASATVALNSAGTGSGENAGAVMADPDPLVVTSPEVEQAAADELGTTVAELGSVATEAAFDPETQIMTITSRADSARLAASAADAYAAAYVDHLPMVVQEQVDELDVQIEALSEQIRDARATLKVRQNDPEAVALQDTGEVSLNLLTAQRTGYRTLVSPGQVVTSATAGPVGLGAVTILGIAVLAGIAAGIGIAFLRRGLDVRVRTIEQAAEVADAPMLAEVTGLRKSLKVFADHDVLPVASRRATPFTESVRELRTAVQVSIQHHAHPAIVVTAADPAVPRAFVTANLAVSLALSGRRTIVLSGDMRRPEIDELLPPPPTWRGSTRELRPTTIMNLRLYPVPDQPLDPADFLATSVASGLVDSLRADADVVVIDVPPVLAAADATILGSYADGTLLLAAAGKTSLGVLGRAADRLRTSGVRLLGVALVGVAGNHRIAYATTYGQGGDMVSSASSPQEPDAVVTGQAAGSPPSMSGGMPIDVRGEHDVPSPPRSTDSASGARKRATR